MSFFEKLFNRKKGLKTTNNAQSKEWDLYGINVSPEQTNTITIKTIKKRIPDYEILSEDDERYEIARKDNYKVIFYVSKKGGLIYVIVNGEAEVSFLSLKSGSPMEALLKLGWNKIDSIYRMGIHAITFKKTGCNSEIQVRIEASDNTINEIHYKINSSNQ